jgi:hypothetical protein
MPNCCPKPAERSSLVRCPESGWVGKPVGRRTVQALLTETALQRLSERDYAFCPDVACDVVYFDDEDSRFTTADVRVAVWQKCAFGDRQICYCFGESEASIRAEFASAGTSGAADRIREHITAGRCACEIRNPRGACCLGDVVAAVARIDAEFVIDAAPSNE